MVRAPVGKAGVVEGLELRRLMATTPLTSTAKNLAADLFVGLTFDGDGNFIDNAPNVVMPVSVGAKSRVDLSFSATPGTFVITEDNFNPSRDYSDVSSPDALAASAAYRLYADSNTNGSFDAGDQPLMTSFTRNAASVEVNAGTYFIVVSTGQTAATNRFGNATQVKATATGTVTAKATQVLGAKASVKGNNIAIADGDTSPATGDGTDFGTATVGGATVSKSFVVTNTGGATLTLGGISKPSGFIVQTPLPTSLAAGASATFKIGLVTTNAGTFSGNLSFSTNDTAANPFNFAIKGVVTAASAPKAVVKGNGITIADGDAVPATNDGTNFGSVEQGSAEVVRSFVLTNTGNATLTIANMGVPSGFIVRQALPATLAKGASATFKIGLLTSAAGTNSGTLSFRTNDASVGNYSFNLTGTVTPVVGEPAPFAEVQNGILVVTGTSSKNVIGVDVKPGVIRAGMIGGELLSFPIDSVSGIRIDAGGGNDKLTIETTVDLPATLIGGSGRDVLLGGSGDDSLSGGSGNDKLVGRLGADTLDGGDGNDIVEYTDRLNKLQGVSASLDGIQNDGQAGENDFILNTIEYLLGGRGNDTLIGNDGPNLIAGSRGADQIFGLGGDDTIFAFAETNAVDGLSDTIDGGTGTDTVVSDSLDIVTNVP